MKNLITILLLFFAVNIQAQNIKLIHINAKWNQHNNVLLNKMPKNYRGYVIKVKYALLEEQGPGFKKSFAGKPLPIVVLRIGGQTKYQWSADLSFRLKLGAHDILGTIDKVTGLK